MRRTNGPGEASSADGALPAFEAQRRKILQRQRLELLIWTVLGSAVLYASFSLSGVFSTSLDSETLDRIAGFIDRMIPDLSASELFESRQTPGSLEAWFYDWRKWTGALFETVQIAIVGTAFGGAIAFCLAGISAANLVRFAPLRFFFRRFFDTCRTIPDLILAMILASAFGLGPLAGVLTIIISTTGSLGKLFSEAIESVDMRPAEAIRAAGGGVLAQARFGVVPQVLPNIASYWLLRLELNLAVAAALGLVGAGGIGVELQRAISFTEFDTYLAILLMIVGMIFVIDLASQFIRSRLMGRVSDLPEVGGLAAARPNAGGTPA
jgi:phosphonate transport system permease protein